jgi:hypothetical protein
MHGRAVAVALAIALLSAGAAVHATAGDASMSARYGDPQVMPFRGGKAGAFTMVFDDSMISQADNAIPLLNARGLKGTFYLNAGLERYAQRRETWEEVCPKFGHEFGNHTWHHQGAKDLAEADFEIGEASRHIWKLYPNKSKLLLFARGGGTTWGISRDEISTLMAKHLVVRRPRSSSISDESGTAAVITSFPQRAIDEGAWVLVLFHGVGGEWISTNLQAFVDLLDFLVAHRDQLWVTTEGVGYRYQQERQAISRVALESPTDTGFSVVIECDPEKVVTLGLPFAEAYDEPLTVRVRVPASWSRFTVQQGDAAREHQTLDIGGEHCAQFDVRPNLGPAVVTRR